MPLLYSHDCTAMFLFHFSSLELYHFPLPSSPSKPTTAILTSFHICVRMCVYEQVQEVNGRVQNTTQYPLNLEL